VPECGGHAAALVSDGGHAADRARHGRASESGGMAAALWSLAAPEVGVAENMNV